MARPLRIEYPGALYHITTRGNAQANIFIDDKDRKKFLEILDFVVKRFKWICHAYCLMSNHYHLLIETPEPNLSHGMRQLNGIYTQKFNIRHHRSGHIFQGRFKAILVDKDEYFLELARYIVLNPVRVGTVNYPEDYVWSSYRATLGKTKVPGFLTTDWLLARFGDNRRRACQQYFIFVRDGMNLPRSPWRDLKGQIFLGSESFLEKLLAKFSKQKEKLREIPKEQKFPVRQNLEKFFTGIDTLDINNRNLAIYRAHVEGGYKLAEIAKFLGLHYASISRIISKIEEMLKYKT
ncbi:MAG: REP-associated tyrosine transposase [Thermodesulfobacteriota bacterium]